VTSSPRRGRFAVFVLSSGGACSTLQLPPIINLLYHPSPEFLSSFVAKKFFPLPQGARGINKYHFQKHLKQLINI